MDLLVTALQAPVLVRVGQQELRLTMAPELGQQGRPYIKHQNLRAPPYKTPEFKGALI